MKRIILTVLLGVAVSVVAMAGVLSEEQTRDIARNFRQGGARSLVEPSLVYAGEYGEKGARSGDAPAFYVYNYGFDDGFVIVSAEDTALPILAFSDKGQFAIDERMPVQVKEWLRGYCAYIQQVRSGARYLEPAPDLGIDITIAVEPLVQAHWDQAEPYNNLCPPFDAVENCATGCAATAIAQIMRHHEWPETGEGSVVFDGKIIDFSQSRYDWGNMLDTYDYGVSYPEEKCHAVAKLMYDVGVASEMQYGYESGAQNVNIYRSLYTHFKYSKQMQYLVRNTMSTAEWKERIRRELDNGRPVYYGGFAEDMSMGHAFVCDGIDETNNYFHFNWGWSGHCNGYYFLNALNPPMPGIGGGMGNFNADHVAIVGIQPAVEGEADNLNHSVLLMRKGFTTNTSQTSLGRNFYVQIANVWNFGPESIDTQLAIGMFDKEGAFVGVVGQPMNFLLNAFFGKSLSVPISIPKETPAGDYELRVVYGGDNLGWNQFLYYYDCYQYAIPFTVQGNQVVFQAPSQSDVVIEANLAEALPATILPGKLYEMPLAMKNVGGWNFDGQVGYRLLQLPELKEGPQFSVYNADTLVVFEKEESDFIYSEDSKELNIELRVTTPADYILQAYYVDPLSHKEFVAGEWPFTLAEPAVAFERRVVVEIDFEHKDAEKLFDLAEGSAGRLIPVGFSEGNYKDSLLSLCANGVVADRREEFAAISSFVDYEKAVNNMLAEPAIASLKLKGRYTSVDKDSVKFSISAGFAYAIENADMRFSLLAVNKVYGEELSLGDFRGNVVQGFYPDDSFGGIAGVVPGSVKPNVEYAYELVCPVTPNGGEMFFVGLLIDGETGEICNAVLLDQNEIAPMDGVIVPSEIALECEEAVMNTGICIDLKVNVYPNAASQDIVWTSSNTEVASFDKWGRLVTLAAGTTVVRATSTEDETVYAEMRVTVQEADYAQVQQVKAGYLHYLVDFNACPEELILGGELNGMDIALLRDMSGGENILDDSGLGTTLACPLCSLDISQCRIVEGGEPYYKDYVTENDVIGKEMFKWCLSLKEIKLPSTITSIGDNAFFESERISVLEIPASVKTIGYAPFYGCVGLESFAVAEANTAFKAVDGVLYNYAGTELVAYPSAMESNVYVAIETLNRVHPYAFSEARFLTVFSGNLRLSNIGYGAFYNAQKLENVSLSNRLNVVGEYAFAGCSALKTVSCSRLTPAECADNAFEGVPENCLLLLPDGFDEEYYTAPGWSRFAEVLASVEDVQVKENVRVYAVAGGLKILGICQGESVTVYTPTGLLVAQVKAAAEEISIPLSNSGVYIVRLAGFNAKVVVK